MSFKVSINNSSQNVTCLTNYRQICDINGEKWKAYGAEVYVMIQDWQMIYGAELEMMIEDWQMIYGAELEMMIED